MAETRDEATSVKEDLTWPKIIAYLVGAVCCLYLFLCGLSLMGGAFKVLGGEAASAMFSVVSNPVSGLMAGILATVLVQSSSTSTSVVVSMVAEGAITVKSGIPIIMGANIGTAVTSTIVSMGQAGDRIQLERAFAGATIHDMFNTFTVATLLPLEVIVGAIQGEGGPLYWITYKLTELITQGEKGNELFTSPIKAMTAPLVNGILKANKYVIYALTLDKPVKHTSSVVNETLCASNNSTRRLFPTEGAEDITEEVRSLLSRRMSDMEDCSHFYCVSKTLDKNFKKISKSSYSKLTSCSGLILDQAGDPCGNGVCYLDAGKFYETKVERGRMIKAGFLEGAGDTAGGVIGLVLSLIILCVGLIGLCKLLQKVFLGESKKILRMATNLNVYVAMLIGLGITIIAQSSSVVTAALTPLCGIGVLPLEKMLPLTLGANIGTTMTALLASLVSLKFDAVQIALCHLFFNILGIILWFPIPPMREIPLAAARLLGLYASFYRIVPVIYIFVAFLLIPGVCIGISAVFNASTVGGVVLLLLALIGLAVFEYMWIIGIPTGNALCYKVLTKEQREQRQQAHDQQNRPATEVDQQANQQSPPSVPSTDAAV